jgi:mutual gliding-motility protein MglA
MAGSKRLSAASTATEGGAEMPHIDTKKKQINCKIVYYGTGMGGKTTNIKHIHSKTDPERRGKMVSLATETERTLFFDFVPIEFEPIQGLTTRFHFYTVPGQSFYNLSRKAILKGVDGIVFVADSQAERHEANIDSLVNLNENLLDYKYDLRQLPHVVQYNKRDMKNVVSVEQLRRDLNPLNVLDFEAVASEGTGVFETMRALVNQIVERIQNQL